jgi:1,4-alpha-glucan branching enzyme
VPAHFPKDEWALSKFDGTALYEHEDPRLGEHPDWGTLIFNYERHEVRNFLISSALYWMEEFHIDGIRVDAVASMLYLDYSRKAGEWIPNKYGGNENLGAIEFLKELNGTCYKRNPGIMMIAEESTAFPGVTSPTENGGLGFGYKWNMGWMHDTLDYFSHPAIYRKYHHHEVTHSISYAFSENYILPLSHDEVVHGKGSLISRMPGDRWQALANLKTLFSFMWSHPGKKLLFMGSEFAQSSEWNEGHGLWWDLLNYQEHQQISDFIGDLNNCYKNQSELWEKDNDPNGFIWLRGDENERNLMAFARENLNGDKLVAIHNFSPTVYQNYILPVPTAGKWKVILNSDDLKYGGSGVGNGEFQSFAQEFYGFNNCIEILLPPLGSLWLAQV